MTVAIVEDCIADAALLEKHLRVYGEKKGVSFQVSKYTESVVFVDAIRRNYFDIVFMDVDMPGINGMEASELLRQVDDQAVLIFVTKLQKYAVRGYEVRAFDFCIKPITYETLEYKLNRLFAYQKGRSKTIIELRTRESCWRVNTDEICYVEVRNHSLVYHTASRNIEVRGKMKDAVDLLAEHGFALCNVSYLVNLHFVTAVEGDTVFVGGNELKISRPKRKQFMECLQKSI